MKKIIFTLLFFVTSLTLNNLFAQACANPTACSPSGLIFDGGFEHPDSTPCVIQGVAYNHAIQFKMYSMFTFPGVGDVTVDSIEFVSIDNLPCGLCWSVNQTDKRYSADEDGCISIVGTTNDPTGQYKFALVLKAWINGNGPSVPSTLVNVPSTLVDQ